MTEGQSDLILMYCFSLVFLRPFHLSVASNIFTFGDNSLLEL